MAAHPTLGEGLKIAGSGRARPGDRSAASAQVGVGVGYPAAMKIYTRKNALVGYLVLEARKRAIQKKVRRAAGAA